MDNFLCGFFIAKKYTIVLVLTRKEKERKFYTAKETCNHIAILRFLFLFLGRS